MVVMPVMVVVVVKVVTVVANVVWALVSKALRCRGRRLGQRPQVAHLGKYPQVGGQNGLP